MCHQGGHVGGRRRPDRAVSYQIEDVAAFSSDLECLPNEGAIVDRSEQHKRLNSGTSSEDSVTVSGISCPVHFRPSRQSKMTKHPEISSIYARTRSKKIRMAHGSLV